MDGVSDRLIPRYLLTGMEIDFNKHCQLEFGTYVQTHDEHDNSMQPRTTGAIALRPMGNAQGGWYFFSLKTGMHLTRTHWTRLPMPTEAIDSIHRLARRGKHPHGFTFGWAPGHDMDDGADTEMRIGIAA